MPHRGEAVLALCAGGGARYNLVMNPDVPVTPEEMALAQGLASRICFFDGSAARRTVLLEAFQEWPGERIVAVIQVFDAGQKAKIHRYREAMLALQDLLGLGDALGEETYELKQRIYAAARSLGQDDIARWMLNPPGRYEISEEELRLNKDLARLTLGERRAHAKGIRREMLERLILDHDSIVIRNLLNNPRIREPDVLVMATRRPVAAVVLEEIFRSERWRYRVAIREALVRNSYFPVGLGLKLLGEFTAPLLAQIAKDNNLHPEITTAARRLHRQKMSLRHGGDSPPEESAPPPRISRGEPPEHEYEVDPESYGKVEDEPTE
ncbi:MAG: hypothetical protein GMKNLPBB_01249 [Myxococcota bacterium]|nr:hypothetical protein [Myxococcota bacterium]